MTYKLYSLARHNAPENNMVELNALIKNLSIKSLVSGDAECEMRLRFTLDKVQFVNLVALYDAQKEVELTVNEHIE